MVLTVWVWLPVVLLLALWVWLPVLLLLALWVWELEPPDVLVL